MIAVLQSISAISTTNGRPSILVPLFFVLTVTAIKDAIEDYHRAKSDRAKNLAVYQAYRRSDDGNSKSGQTGQWVKEYSKDILVGDLIRIYENQRIPADVLLLASGIDKCTHAFVDTKDLDGETNLKPKFVPLNVLKYLKGAADLAAAQQPEELQAASNGGGNGFGSAGDGGAGAGSPSATALSDMQNAIMLRRLQRMRLELECDEPNGDMSEWHATLTIQPPVPSGGGQSSARASAVGGAGAGVTPFVQNLGLDALILSECVVRNTPFVIGLVCYTGDGTKLRQNMSKQLNNARIKETSVFRLTKKLFAFMALAQLLLCIAAAIACGILQGRVQDSALYLQFRNSPATAGFLQFFSWFILCKDFVPISLYVSMELVQFWQALFMGLDEKMAVQQIKVLSHEEEAADEKQQQQQMTTSVNGRQRGASGSKSSGIGFEAPSHQAHEPAASASGVALSPASAPSAGSGSGGGGGGPRVVYETIYAKAQTSRLNEGLSEVSFVFSDKTGTLTQNSMIFKKCVIGSARYGLTSTEAGVIRRAKLENRSVDSALREFSAQRETREARRRAEGLVPFPHVEFDQADELAAALAGAGPPPGSEASSGSFSSSASSGSSSAHNEQHAREVREFLLALALNNAVFPKVDPMRSGAPDASAVQLPPARGPRQSLLQVSPLHGGGVIGGSGAGSKSSAAPAGPRYDLSNPCTNAVMALDSSSPDEKALCYFAQYLGFELFARAGGRTKLRVRDPPQQSSKSQSAARNAKNNSAASTSGGGGTLAHFEEYADVCMLDFSAKRKRMTVLVEEINPSTGQPNGKIKVLCKGADSFVYPLLAGASASEAAHLEPQGELDPVDNQPSPLGLATPARGGGGGGGSDSPVRKSPLTPLHGSSPAGAAGSASPPGSNSSSPNAPSGPRNWDWTYSCLTEMGGESLRTLIVASGERERSWWFGSDATGSDGLKSVYERTQRAQGESEKGHTDGSCSSSCSMCAIETRIEREAGMHIVGATAIEDLLQQGVGPALKQLLDAKISIWVLTSDSHAHVFSRMQGINSAVSRLLSLVLMSHLSLSILIVSVCVQW
jgi:magnesium-transporting ATPase (P-type)